MTKAFSDPFPTVSKLAKDCGATWPCYKRAAQYTVKKEQILREILSSEGKGGRLLDSDSSLVLCGSFARYEMVKGSDCDWTLLINGVVNNRHADIARKICRAFEKESKKKNGLRSPGTSGTFGNLAFSHDLVHRIGGGADSNENLTRRILMLLESRPIHLSPADSSGQIWTAVLRSILERYFEEDVHFSPSAHKVPRFLLNDLTRYWRTICVDYAAKHREQDGKKWAIRNAKLRFSRKLLYASGLAFCFNCHLHLRVQWHKNLFDEVVYSADPFIEYAMDFARTPPLEYLARFIESNVKDDKMRKRISRLIFGSYNAWLKILNDGVARTSLESLSHLDARKDPVFQRIRTLSSQFAKGLQLLYFNRDSDYSPVANLSLEYVAF